MISTFPGIALVQPLQRQQGRERSRSSGGLCRSDFLHSCWTPAAVLLLILGWAARCRSALLESSSNITLTADNSCLIDSISNGTFKLYPLDFQDCLGEDVNGWLNVELLVTNRTTLNATPDGYNPVFWLMVDTRGELPELNITKNGSGGSGTVFADIGDDPNQSNYTSLSLPLSEFDENFPWYASVTIFDENVNFFLRAWCTARKGCADSCSEAAERCVNVGTCKCMISEGNTKCHTDVIPLQYFGWDDDGVQVASSEGEFLAYGEWKYFSFEVGVPNARILVELSRAEGDLALFLKPKDEDDSFKLPSESDFERYADTSSFRNRLSYQYVYRTGEGSYYVGILNNDACVQKSSIYNLTVTVASPNSTWALCPMNCSHPQGTCVKDGVCECAPGYAGEICDGSMMSAELSEKLTGSLSPGRTAYFSLGLGKLSKYNNMSIKFVHGGGHPILLGQLEGLPTLTNNSLKFAEAPSLENVTNTYYINPINYSENQKFLFAIFNADDIVRGDAVFELIILGLGGGYASTELKPTLIILVGFLSSLFACVGMGLVKFIMYRWRAGDDQSYIPEEAENVEDVSTMRQGLDKSFVETFPTVAFQEDMKLQETECAICLSEFVALDLLRVIPLCTHIFHVSCGDQWLMDHANCPVCRVALDEDAMRSSSIPVSTPVPSPLRAVELGQVTEI